MNLAALNDFNLNQSLGFKYLNIRKQIEHITLGKMHRYLSDFCFYMPGPQTKHTVRYCIPLNAEILIIFGTVHYTLYSIGGNHFFSADFTSNPRFSVNYKVDILVWA